MSAEDADQSQSGYDEGGMGGPGAPTPLAALEVTIDDAIALSGVFLMCSQGVAGLTKRDIQLIIEGGFYTVEAVAYTYVDDLMREIS